MKLLTFKKGVYDYYRANVKGNENTGHYTAQKKMTRNMMLAHKTDSTGYDAQMYQYGSLWFVVKNNRVVWMKNYCWTPEGWELDAKRYVELNKELKIHDDTTETDLRIRNLVHSFKHFTNKLHRELSV